jgi:hypothetical protein
MAAHVEIDRLHLLAQRHHIDARRHSEQNVPHAHALAGAVAACVRRVIAAARRFRRLRYAQFVIEQPLNGAGCRFADDAVGRRFIRSLQQAAALRGLAQ